MQLVFVYNADSGVFNTMTDIAHKLLSPATYQCNLCNLTHGYFKVREQWVDFLQKLDVDIAFLHRDEYIQQNQTRAEDLPAIFVRKDGQLKLWMNKENINKMKSTDELMQLISTTLQNQQTQAENIASGSASEIQAQVKS